MLGRAAASDSVGPGVHAGSASNVSASSQGAEVAVGPSGVPAAGELADWGVTKSILTGVEWVERP